MDAQHPLRAAHAAAGAPGLLSAPRALTLNVTGRAMAEMGYCPSGRLFEAPRAARRSSATSGRAWTTSSSRAARSSSRALPKTCCGAMALRARELSRIARAARRTRTGAPHGGHSAAELEAHTRTRRIPCAPPKLRMTAPESIRCRRSNACGASSRPPASAAAFSRWHFRRNCCRSAAAAMDDVERPARGQRVPRRAHDSSAGPTRSAS